VVGLHPVYLGQLFAKEVRQTLGDFVNDLRVRAAAEELSCGSASLAEIATENGFYDQSHFSRVFGRKVGVSPGAFRRQYRHGMAGRFPPVYRTRGEDYRSDSEFP
jgi:AraC-like DNA-binding protein